MSTSTLFSDLSERVGGLLAGNSRISSGRILNILSIIGGVILWEAAARAFGVVILAPPSSVAESFIELMVSLALPMAIFGSLQALVVGYLIAAFIAIPLGFLIAQSKYVLWALDPYIDAVYTAPPIVYLPLVVVWFGLGFEARVFFVFIFSFFEILLNTYQGITTVKDDHLITAQSFGASWWQTQSRVIFPASIPFIFTGLRLGIGRAVRGVIVAELFLRLVNLGQLLQSSNAVLNTSIQFAVVITIAILGIFLQQIVAEVRKLVAPWDSHGEQRGA
ncbi:ABC transporter permease [Haladaptatus sp. CMSO5]|uniref:ABC transporter permease n=1 Tax=Haladaptatus sp. CMSO5 TaxID=3120514 RepID=UPI002FCE0FB2